MMKNNISFSPGTIRRMADPAVHPTMARLYDAALKLHDIDGQSALADRLNESPQTLNNWDRRGISQRGAIKAAGILGCSAQWIIRVCP